MAIGGAFGEAVDEARTVAQQILDGIHLTNHSLAKLLDANAAAAPKALSKFNVIAEGRMIVAQVPEQTYPGFSVLGTPPAGVYWRIDHWAYLEAEIGSNGCQCLAIGDGQRLVAVVDLPDGYPIHEHEPAPNVLPVGKSNPHNLIIPPNVPLLATSTPGTNNNAAQMFVSYTAFELSL